MEAPPQVLLEGLHLIPYNDDNRLTFDQAYRRFFDKYYQVLHRIIRLQFYDPRARVHDFSTDTLVRSDSWLTPVLTRLRRSLPFGQLFDNDLHLSHWFNAERNIVQSAVEEQHLFWFLQRPSGVHWEPIQTTNLWLELELFWWNIVQVHKEHLIEQILAGHRIYYLERFITTPYQTRLHFAQLVLLQENPLVPLYSIRSGPFCNYTLHLQDAHWIISNPLDLDLIQSSNDFLYPVPRRPPLIPPATPESDVEENSWNNTPSIVSNFSLDEEQEATDNDVPSIHTISDLDLQDTSDLTDTQYLEI